MKEHAQPHTKFGVKEKLFSNAEFLPEVVKLMDEGHTITLRLKGFSMRPFLEDNRDKALIAKAENIWQKLIPNILFCTALLLSGTIK